MPAVALESRPSVDDDLRVPVQHLRIGLHLPLVAIDPLGEAFGTETLGIDLGAIDGHPDGPGESVCNGRPAGVTWIGHIGNPPGNPIVLASAPIRQ